LAAVSGVKSGLKITFIRFLIYGSVPEGCDVDKKMMVFSRQTKKM